MSLMNAGVAKCPSMQWALLEAAETSDTATLRRLLAAGADPNAHGPFRQTSLHLASRHGTEVAKELVAAGALLPERTTLGSPALHESCGCRVAVAINPIVLPFDTARLRTSTRASICRSIVVTVLTRHCTRLRALCSATWSWAGQRGSAILVVVARGNHIAHV